MRRLPVIALTTTGALAALLALLGLLNACRPLSTRVAGDASRAYPPLALTSIPATPVTPAGSYDCLEYEFGLIWASDVITLNTDGSSAYAHGSPYGGNMTGTWAYDSALYQVTFTNFHWPTATFDAPDRLWATKYLPGPDFEIALECGRRPE